MATDVKTPEALQSHQQEYQSQAWKAYTLMELGSWVHLFAKRAEHRSHAAIDKRKKDLYDARNYLAMMTAHLDALDAETKRIEAGIVQSPQ